MVSGDRKTRPTLPSNLARLQLCVGGRRRGQIDAADGKLLLNTETNENAAALLGPGHEHRGTVEDRPAGNAEPSQSHPDSPDCMGQWRAVDKIRRNDPAQSHAGVSARASFPSAPSRVAASIPGRRVTVRPGWGASTNNLPLPLSPGQCISDRIST